MSEITLTDRLHARADLHRSIQSNLTTAFEGLFPDAPREGEVSSRTYELGMEVGATEVLRQVIPELAEVVDGNPWADERLRILLSDLRAARLELVGDDSLEVQ